MATNKGLRAVLPLRRVKTQAASLALLFGKLMVINGINKANVTSICGKKSGI